jgi:hypothetical protein
MAGLSVARTVHRRGNRVAPLEAYRPLLTALLTLTMLLTVGAAMVAPSRAARDATTLASKTDEQGATAVYGLPRYSEGSSTPSLGGGVLMPAFSEEDDEEECLAGSFAVVVLVVWPVGSVGGLLRVRGEPRRLRTVYEYTRLERPG